MIYEEATQTTPLESYLCFDNLKISTIRLGKGDCIHLCYNGHNLVVDSGPTASAGEFLKLCRSVLATGESLDALIITHYDDDHIGGILKVGDPGFRNIFFNAYDGTAENGNLSAVQNQRLFHILPETAIHSSVLAGDVIEIGGARLTVHGPNSASLQMAKEQMKDADLTLGAASDWNYSFDELMGRNYPSSDRSIPEKLRSKVIRPNALKDIIDCVADKKLLETES